MRRLLILLFLSLLALIGCGETFNNFTGADIVSLEIEPSTVSVSDTGMTDEFFTATIVIADFPEEVDPEDATVFLQEPTRRDAQPGMRSIDGDTITLGMIAKTWVGNLSPGEYSVGAEVNSDTESVTARNLATITIEE